MSERAYQEPQRHAWAILLCDGAWAGVYLMNHLSPPLPHMTGFRIATWATRRAAEATRRMRFSGETKRLYPGTKTVRIAIRVELAK